MRQLATGIAFTLLASSVGVSAQWAKMPDPSIPRTGDGRADLSAPAPRTADGKRDLSGVWLADPDPNGKPQGIEQMVFSQYFVNIAADVKMEDVPMRPEAAALFKTRLQSEGRLDPASRCKPTGVPSVNSAPIPYKILQTPKVILILYEENTVFRQIFLDGRHTVKDPEPRWMGYSTGRWEGDTLVVDTTGFNDGHWLDRMGHPGSDALRVIERFHRRDAGHLDIQVTIDDPKSFTKPLTYTQKTTLVADEDLLEYFCAENEKDVEHFK